MLVSDEFGENGTEGGSGWIFGGDGMEGDGGGNSGGEGGGTLGDGGVLGEAGGGEQNAQALHLHRWQFTSGEFAMEHHAKQASWFGEE